MRLITVLLLIVLCSPCLTQVTQVSWTVAGAGGVAQSGVYTMLGSAGQTGPPGLSTSGVYSFAGGFLTWSGFAALVFQHTAVATAASGTAITVTASVSGGSPLTTMMLYYRRGGDPAFTSLSMTISAGTGQATIPADAVTSRGVEYIIRVNDPASGGQGRIPVSGVNAVQVTLSDPGLQIASLPAEKYRLVSLPINADNPAPGSRIAGSFGAYDNTKWRFFELLANQQYSEFPSVGSMVPGKAFWLITKSGGTFNTGPGRSNLTDRRYAVPLNPGWTFVGDPFNFTIPLAKLSRKSAAALDVRKYADAWQVESGGVDPFSGYAVANGTTSVDTLFVNPDLSTGSLPKPAEPAGELAAWRVGISAQAGTAADEDNEVLVSASASRSLDDMDRPEAPTIGGYVSLYFNHPEWKAVFSRYCTDARPVPVEGETWGFEVSTNASRMVDLRFSGLESVPPAFDIWVVDQDLKTSANLRTTSVFQFPGNGDGGVRHLSLIVGSAAYAKQQLTSTGAIPLQFVLSPNFPNPFNPSTIIQYGLPSSSHVLLEVYDLLGRKVATLVDENEQEGYRTREFDARGYASGVYIYRLTAVPLEGGSRFSQVRKMVLAK